MLCEGGRLCVGIGEKRLAFMHYNGVLKLQTDRTAYLVSSGQKLNVCANVTVLYCQNSTIVANIVYLDS